MKYLFFLLLFCASSVKGQMVKQLNMQITEKSVVKDSSGTIYPYAIWMKLMQTGNYGLKPSSIDNPTDEFILYEFTQKDKEAIMSRSPKPKESPFFVTGSPFGKFKSTDINRKKWNLQELTGKIVVFNFWFINCPPCKREIPELNKLVEKYKDRSDVVFIAIALDDKYDLNKFLQTTPFNYTIIDGGRWIAADFGINSFPTNVVVDQQGIVQFHANGYSMSLPNWIDKTIAGLLEKSSGAVQPK